MKPFRPARAGWGRDRPRARPAPVLPRRPLLPSPQLRTLGGVRSSRSEEELAQLARHRRVLGLEFETAEEPDEHAAGGRRIGLAPVHRVPEHLPRVLSLVIAVAAEGLDAFFGDPGKHEKRCYRVCPPPAQECIRTEPEQE